jgi:MinD superfamily P-loop ATPase
MAPPLIRKVKERVNRDNIVIIDVPPGTSCPVVESVRGSDFCLLVTEPTPFGINDLELAAQTMKELGIPCGVVINRSGNNDAEVMEFCRRADIPVLMTIPLDREIAHLYSRGITLAGGMPEWKKDFSELFGRIREIKL